MRIKSDQLPQQLKNKLAPIYLISGEELLLVNESRELIRKVANDYGFSERISFSIDNNFDWQEFYKSAYTSSLFDEKSLLELHLGSNKIKEPGSSFLQNYAQNFQANKILLLITEKLDAATQKTLWYKAVEQTGIIIQVNSINKTNLSPWIINRMKQNGFSASAEAINILIEHVEGNLLAAAQEIEKLKLVYESGHELNVGQILAAIADSSRFTIYDLVDNALLGNGNKVVRILKSLRQEKIDPILILWVLAKELRALAAIMKSMEQNKNIDVVLQQHHIWEQRKPYIKNIIMRKNLPGIYNLIRFCARLDRVIKGVEIGSVWDELASLSIKIALR